MSSNTLIDAVEAHDLHLVRKLLRRKQNISPKNRSEALSAAINCFTSVYRYTNLSKIKTLKTIVHVLLNNRCSLEQAQDEWYHLLQVAVDNQLQRVVHHFLKKIKIIERVNDLLHEAVLNQDLQVVEWLLENKADVNGEDEYGNVALRFAVDTYCIKENKKLVEQMVEVLLTNGATTKNHPEIFEIAVRHLRSDSIDLILRYDQDFDVNAVNETGYTPLLILMDFGVTIKGKLKKVINIINRGANVNYQTRSGISALHMACALKNEQFVKVLLEAKADVGLKDDLGESALHLAASCGSAKICLMLLEAGADIHAVMVDPLDEHKREQGALELACSHGQIECVDVLLKHGGLLVNNRNIPFNSLIDDVTIRDEDFYDYDQFNNDNRIIRLIEEHIIKLVVAKLQVEQDDLDYFDIASLKDNELVPDCESELKRMMELPIGAPHVSYYDILTSNSNRIVKYLRNEETRQKLDEYDYKNEFFYYGRLLDNCIKKAKERADLLNSSANCLNIVSENRLPYLATKRILDFLNESDMKTLNQAVNK